jgi:GNAT superfamily N-acetyltransferase
MPPIFDYIGNHPEHIPLIAQWHQNEWQHISPQLTTELRIAQYAAYSSSASIPFCIIALIDRQPVGSASLVISDMETRPHLTPWLASVYIESRFRCQGIATQLIERCVDKARESAIDTLYLFTPDQLSFYRHRGWKPVETCEYHKEKVDIMSLTLNTRTHTIDD